MSSSKSQIRQNYHDESEGGVNKQINMELYASYVYAAMVSDAILKKYFSYAIHVITKLVLKM